MKRPITPEGYLIDIEGVLVRDKRYEPVPGAPEWLAGLAHRGRPYCLVSNNTTHRPEDLIDVLGAAGFTIPPDRLVSALGLGRQWLEENGRRRLLWLGQPQLADYWRDEGFEPATTGPIDAVVLGANHELDIADLDAALPALQGDGADLVCLHRNLYFLDDTGSRRLGPGAWAAALEGVVGTGRTVTIGKPEPRIYHSAVNKLGVAAEKTLFISDDPVADLVTAGRLGMGTAFVLSGKYEDAEILGSLPEEDWPDQVCASCGFLQPEAEA